MYKRYHSLDRSVTHHWIRAHHENKNPFLSWTTARPLTQVTISVFTWTRPPLKRRTTRDENGVHVWLSLFWKWLTQREIVDKVVASKSYRLQLELESDMKVLIKRLSSDSSAYSSCPSIRVFYHFIFVQYMWRYPSSRGRGVRGWWKWCVRLTVPVLDMIYPREIVGNVAATKGERLQVFIACPFPYLISFIFIQQAGNTLFPFGNFFDIVLSLEHSL